MSTFPLIRVKAWYKKMTGSIAFLPAIISIAFLLVSYFMINFDYSAAGKNIKANLHWLSLKDASTARSICSVIAGGIISLAVFSFSMVMILLNQAASKMSNRIIDKLIGNRFQQLVLGFYIGTIVYSLFLLSTVREINSGIYVPAISTYFLIALTIADIFLFIYFLHYVTRSIKYETVIREIHKGTKEAMKKSCIAKIPVGLPDDVTGVEINAYKSGLYQGFEKSSLLNLCSQHNIEVYVLYPIGTYLVQGTPALILVGKGQPAKELIKQLAMEIYIDNSQEINTSYYYGFRQLMEIAVKALSPGINDPGTAVISLHALSDLFAYRFTAFPETDFKDDSGVTRITTRHKTFEELFEECFFPIWDYGKNDRVLRNEMDYILTLLKTNGKEKVIENFAQKVTTFMAHES